MGRVYRSNRSKLKTTVAHRMGTDVQISQLGLTLDELFRVLRKGYLSPHRNSILGFFDSVSWILLHKFLCTAETHGRHNRSAGWLHGIQYMIRFRTYASPFETDHRSLRDSNHSSVLTLFCGYFIICCIQIWRFFFFPRWQCKIWSIPWRGAHCEPRNTLRQFLRFATLIPLHRWFLFCRYSLTT